MGIGSQIEDALSEYILANVDQLSEGVIEFNELTSGGEDEDGGWVISQVYVTYRVSRDVNRFGNSGWRFNGGLQDLIYELDHWKDRY